MRHKTRADDISNYYEKENDDDNDDNDEDID